MKTTLRLGSLLIILASFSASSIAEERAKSYRGPLPAAQRALIHTLAENHQKLTREVQLTEKGYTAKTTSTDKELVKALKQHVAYMEKRLGSGAMVRRWDPAYEEFVNHYSDIKVAVKPLPDGLAVEVTATNPDAIAVARNHARIVTEFTKKGPSEVAREHLTATEFAKTQKETEPTSAK